MALDVDRIDVDGVWYRHLPHRGSVWWRSEPPPDGRWQRGAAVGGFCLADSRETAWAEWYRQIDELALRPTDQLPRDLWRFDVAAKAREGQSEVVDAAKLIREVRDDTERRNDTSRQEDS